jgi:dTDP-L-rhamnose 4-epimerase
MLNPYTGVLALFGRLAVAGESIDLYEDGEMLRDFVFVDDVIDAMVAALCRPPLPTRLLDIGSGQPTTLAHVAHLMSTMRNGPSPAVSGRFREGDVRAAHCDIQAARDGLDYRPRYDVAKGIATLLSWIESAHATAVPVPG